MSFVDFSHVWLAYNDELAAKGQYAVEDINLSARLRRIARPACLRDRVVVSARRWEQRGVARTVVEMWLWRAAYAVGVSPERLHRLYYGRS
jgi:hypothetical protein